MACGPTPLAKGKVRRIALVAETAADARDVMCEGDSGIMGVHPADFRPHYQPSMRRLTWPNGCVAMTFSGADPEQLRGPQFDCAWVDEIAKYRYAQDAWDMLQFGLRLGDDPRQLVTTTPRPIQLLKRIIADPTTITVRGKTRDNAMNLAPSFLKQIETRYAGTRLGRQELDAEILDDAPDSLWRRSNLDEYRIGLNAGAGDKLTYRGQPFTLPSMQRVVVAIDPAASAGGDALEGQGAETGIIVAGLGVDARGYLLDDLTCNLGPDGWARRAVSAVDTYQADLIVAEANNGGAMVEQVIRSVRPGVRVILVHASRGKVTRAEPVSALYEQGRVSHVGAFPQLEDQMVVFTPFGIIGDTTADRVDALVWGLSQLFPQIISIAPREPIHVVSAPLMRQSRMIR